MKMSVPRWGRFAALALVSLLALAVGAWASAEAQAAGSSAAVVYFYPSDFQPEQQYIDQIGPTVSAVQQWYGAQVGKTFAVSPTVVVKGDRDSGWYKCSPSYCDGSAIWFNVLVELRGKGYRICQDQMLIVSLASSIPFQGGGSCGGSYTADTGGVAMFTETLLDPILGKPPPDPERCPLGSWCYSPDASRGVIAHELGHAFTLPHPKGCGTSGEPSYCAETVMWAWWNYPDVGLLDVREAPEKQTLANSPFFWVTPDTTSGTGGGGGDADTLAPTVNILRPTNGEIIKGRWFRVTAEGTDNVGVAEMELYIDSQLVFATKGASLDFKWDTRGIAKGVSLTVTVKARDEAGNVGVAQVRVIR